MINIKDYTEVKQMELGIEGSGGDNPKKGPCLFEKVKEEQQLFCPVKGNGKACRRKDNVPSECGHYWILGEKLMRQIRVACRCGRAEFNFNGKWGTREETPVSAINNSTIPEDIWNGYWPLLPRVPCGKRGLEKE